MIPANLTLAEGKWRSAPAPCTEKYMAQATALIVVANFRSGSALPLRPADKRSSRLHTP
jgi:hypothetical protein